MYLMKYILIDLVLHWCHVFLHFQTFVHHFWWDQSSGTNLEIETGKCLLAKILVLCAIWQQVSMYR